VLDNALQRHKDEFERMVRQEKQYEELKKKEVEKWREAEKKKFEEQKLKNIGLQEHIVKQI
jgi:hypothetical protein